MHRGTRAVQVELLEVLLYFRKHNRIIQFSYDHASQRCGEAESMPI